MKASPATEVVKYLADLGSNFDCASIYELDRVLDCGVTADRISYGNTIKKQCILSMPIIRGIDLYATDSKADLINIANNAPGSKVFVRILVHGADTAEWPLSRKFGCHPDMAIDLLVQAKIWALSLMGSHFMWAVSKKMWQRGMMRLLRLNICLTG